MTPCSAQALTHALQVAPHVVAKKCSMKRWLAWTMLDYLTHNFGSTFCYPREPPSTHSEIHITVVLLADSAIKADTHHCWPTLVASPGSLSERVVEQVAGKKSATSSMSWARWIRVLYLTSLI